ncbi:TIGR04438 family Trp-rich protein [Comamonas testosteroni]|uniref:TIGR04438 family Trp-rich protein n=1 Tax=Comamonas testosteroni TaxID=285 RepID=A0A373FJK3_COMTE|nr:TIGR04438 family Trp-rich protein [Comamonas testosteroni]RGE43675.1 TIGR04438 family Trp-rich protein [Comamonas testosteroni]
MYLLGLAILLSLLKLAEIGPPATWSWWYILAVYGATAVWWAWADASGYTKRKAMQKMDKRVQDRVNRQKEAMQPGKRR